MRPPRVRLHDPYSPRARLTGIFAWRPHLPSLSMPSLPRPHAPSWRPHLPRMSAPSLPRPHMPSVSAPSLPRPHMPSVSMPKLPRLRIPSFPAGAAGMALMLLISCAAAAGGAALAMQITGNADASEAPRAPVPQPDVEFNAGDFSVALPPGWSGLERRPQVPGFAGESTVAVQGPRADAIVADLPISTPSLLPPVLVSALGGDVPQPRDALVGGQVGLLYDDLDPDPERRVDVYVLPTTRGAATIACVTRGADGSGCEVVAARLALGDAAPLQPNPGLALGLALPARIEALDEARMRGRRALAGSRTPTGRERIIERLADAYARAAEDLRPLAVTSGDLGLIAALRELERSHRALARAAVRRRPAAWDRAARRIDRGDAELARRLQDRAAD